MWTPPEGSPPATTSKRNATKQSAVETLEKTTGAAVKPISIDSDPLCIDKHVRTRSHDAAENEGEGGLSPGDNEGCNNDQEGLELSHSLSAYGDLIAPSLLAAVFGESNTDVATDTVNNNDDLDHSTVTEFTSVDPVLLRCPVCFYVSSVTSRAATVIAAITNDEEDANQAAGAGSSVTSTNTTARWCLSCHASAVAMAPEAAASVSPNAPVAAATPVPAFIMAPQSGRDVVVSGYHAASPDTFATDQNEELAPRLTSPYAYRLLRLLTNASLLISDHMHQHRSVIAHASAAVSASMSANTSKLGATPVQTLPQIATLAVAAAKAAAEVGGSSVSHAGMFLAAESASLRATLWREMHRDLAAICALLSASSVVAGLSLHVSLARLRSMFLSGAGSGGGTSPFGTDAWRTAPGRDRFEAAVTAAVHTQTPLDGALHGCAHVGATTEAGAALRGLTRWYGFDAALRQCPRSQHQRQRALVDSTAEHQGRPAELAAAHRARRLLRATASALDAENVIHAQARHVQTRDARATQSMVAKTAHDVVTLSATAAALADAVHTPDVRDEDVSDSEDDDGDEGGDDGIRSATFNSLDSVESLFAHVFGTAYTAGSGGSVKEKKKKKITSVKKNLNAT